MILLTTNIMQILLDMPYDTAVDWWAFGVVAYQMNLQQSPFRGEDEDEIYDAILQCEPLYPTQLNRCTVDFLQRLLTRKPDQRLGSGPDGTKEVMEHPYFESVDWDDMYHKRVPPPLKPAAQNPRNVESFTPNALKPILTPLSDSLARTFKNLCRVAALADGDVADITTEEQEKFNGFSFSRE
jgi:serine/threonine protein kinase